LTIDATLDTLRIITSSSRDLSEGIKKGKFDAELARVLGLRRLSIPTLAERREDVVVLANSIVKDRALSSGKVLESVSLDSEKLLAAYSWPGNLGELKSVVERAVMLSKGSVVEIPPELLQEGRRVGGYSLQRQLGSGAMGEVWLAQHSLLARPAAVKLIRQEALQGDAKVRETLEKRFRREAEATAQLRSPHTVELYDFGVTEDGDFYYVMEFLHGLDLDSLVTKFGPVDPARAIFLLRQACMSLGEAHDAGLVHRDIKPANLFTCRLGPHYDFLKLLDFGIVRTTDNASHTVTSPGELKGTPNSLAPEVIQGEEAGAAADLYGLGCVAYWLLTGQHVFEAPHLMALLMQHMSKPPKALSEHRSDLPDELERLVLQCLEKDPSKRPTTAYDVEKGLSSIFFDDPWDIHHAAVWWKQSLSTAPDNAHPGAHSETIQLTAADTD
jgi:serine/threonine protein kinase